MIQLLGIRALAAPNVWGTVPVLECRLACEPISDDLIDGIFQRLQQTPRSALLMERRHFQSTSHAVVDLALTLQRCSDCAVAAGEVRPTPFAHIWQLAFEIEEEPIGRAALEAACRMLATAEEGRPVDVDEHLAHVRTVADRHSFGGTTRVLAAAARRREIPVYRLDGESLIQFGQGNQQHRMRMAATDRTGFIAEWISRDKLLSKHLLQKAGIPVADGRHVVDADDACRAAQEIGAAVVVKPCDADFGHGVTVNLTDPSPIRNAYDFARMFSRNILVERYLRGYWHRLLIVDGRMIAALRKEPPRVIGDGIRNIAQLVEELNADPRRGPGEEHPLDPLKVGATVLGMLYRQGYSLDSVPPLGTTVLLRQDAYLSSGATQSDVTDRVHPDIAELAVSAAETIGLDVAGVDVICEDVSRSLSDQALGVLEVNAEPALVAHLAPASIPSRPVPDRILEMLFPSGDNGRVPVIVVVGDRSLADALADHLRTLGKTVGLAALDHASVNGRGIGYRQMSVRTAAEALWMQRRVSAAVIHVTLADVLREGMPVDQWDLLCLAELEATDGSPESGSDEFDRAVALLLQTGLLSRDVLVNLDSSAVCRRIPWPVPLAVLVSSHPDCPEVRRHTVSGGRAILPLGDRLVLQTMKGERDLSGWQPESPLLETTAKAWISRMMLAESPEGLSTAGSCVSV